MKIKHDTRCQCGHLASSHTVGVWDGRTLKDSVDIKMVWKNPFKPGCGGGGYSYKNCECKKFQLNNLDFIEYLAEKRGLI